GSRPAGRAGLRRAREESPAAGPPIRATPSARIVGGRPSTTGGRRACDAGPAQGRVGVFSPLDAPSRDDSPLLSATSAAAVDPGRRRAPRPRAIDAVGAPRSEE